MSQSLRRLVYRSTLNSFVARTFIHILSLYQSMVSSVALWQEWHLSCLCFGDTSAQYFSLFVSSFSYFRRFITIITSVEYKTWNPLPKPVLSPQKNMEISG